VVQLHFEGALAPLPALRLVFLRRAGVVQDGVLGSCAGQIAGTPQRNEALRDFGADDYLIKPIQTTLLADILDRHLGVRALT
jgi:hypothetical protein